MELNITAKRFRNLLLTKSVETFSEEDVIQGAYPGEYLDNARIYLELNHNIQDIEEIAYVLATNNTYWHDENTGMFNRDQRERVYTWLECHAKKSVIVSSSLCVLYASEQSLKQPLRNPEACTRMILDNMDFVRKETKAKELITVLSLLPELSGGLGKLIDGFLANVDVYTQTNEIEKLLLASLKEKWCLKNKLITNMRKLISMNVTPNSSPYQNLRTRFTAREICYMNMCFVNAGSAKEDKIILSFFCEIILGKETQRINEQERVAMKRHYLRYYVRKINNCEAINESIREIIILPDSHGYPCLENNDDWEFLYSLIMFKTENGEPLERENVSFCENKILLFNPTKKINYKKWGLLKEPHKKRLYNCCFSIKKSMDDYSQQEKEEYKLLFDLGCKTWGKNLLFETLNSAYCYSAITVLVQLGFIDGTKEEHDRVIKGKKVSEWIKSITRYPETAFSLKMLIEIVEKYSIFPEWIDASNYDLIKKRLLAVTDELCTREDLYKFFGILMDILWKENPSWYLDTVKTLFSQCDAIHLERFIPEKSLNEYARFYLEDCGLDDEDGSMRKHIMTKTEFQAWKNKEIQKKEDRKKLEVLLDFRNNLITQVERFIQNGCNLKKIHHRYYSAEILKEVEKGIYSTLAIRKLKEEIREKNLSLADAVKRAVENYEYQPDEANFRIVLKEILE